MSYSQNIFLYNCIALYGQRHLQTLGQQNLLLRRHQRSRQRPAPHHQPNLPWCRRTPRRPGPPSRALRRLRGAAVNVATAPLGPLHRPLPAAGGHSPHLPARPQDHRRRLVSPQHPAFVVGICSRARIAPLPARMSGRFALLSRSNARSTILSSGTDRRKRFGLSGWVVASALAMSSGSSICTAPGFSVRGSQTAFLTTSGIVFGCKMLVAHFVTGSNIATTSMIWCDSLCKRCEEPCPVSTSMGARSMLASATPVTRLVAPGPRAPTGKSVRNTEATLGSSG